MAKRLTYKDAEFHICSTAQNGSDLNQTAFAALTYIKVSNVRTAGEWGAVDAVQSFDAIDDTFSQKQKRLANAGDPQIEFGTVYSDAGQDAVRAASLTDDHYAMYLKLADGTKIYNRGLVIRGGRTEASVDGFVVERFTLGHIQAEVIVEPA